MKVLITHAFSTKNLGDGLLVEETIDLIYSAFGPNVEITLAAHYPQTFSIPGITKIRSAPNKFGYSPSYLRVLATIRSFDLIVAVGGGYLRYGYPLEGLKTTLVHTPQLLATSLSGRPSVYLPQSIGPLRGSSRIFMRPMLRKTSRIYLRDARSIEEVNLPQAVRFPDLAALDISGRSRELGSPSVDSVPVLQVRAVRGAVPAGIYTLDKLIGEFDSYIQSTTGGNNDVPATNTLNYRKIITKSELLGLNDKPRVIIAMRLHAALMALRAGHYVIHLSYERKGFGAFEDLGLSDYVFNVNDFNPLEVLARMRELLESTQRRFAYDQAINSTGDFRSNAKNRLIEDLKIIANSENL